MRAPTILLVTKLEVDDNLVATGISAEIDGLVTTLGITSNDSWTITVPEEAEEWIYLPTTSGTGNSEVLVSIDANFGSSESRSTTLTVKAGDQTCKVPVIQRPTYKGEAVTNNSNSITPIAIAEQKGVGLGYDLDKFAPKANSVINLGAVEQLQTLNSNQYRYLFTYNAQNSATTSGAVVDSVETKSDSLGVSLSFDVSYGKFKLGITGQYHGYENKTHLSDAYKCGATYNIASASTDIPSIIALYEDSASAPNATEKALRKSLLSPGFIRVKSQVETAYKKNEKDNKTLNKAIKKLVSTYGIAVISGCQLGGDIAMEIQFDLDSLGETMNVDKAKLRMGTQAGLLKVEADVEASYLKQAVELLSKSVFRFNISGGETKAFNDLAAALTNINRTKNDTVDISVHNKIIDWVNSIDANKGETLSYTKLTISPIWEFFEDIDVSAAVEDWIETNFPTAYETLGIKLETQDD